MSGLTIKFLSRCFVLTFLVSSLFIAPAPAQIRTSSGCTTSKLVKNALDRYGNVKGTITFTNIVCPHKGPASPATFQHKRTPPGGGISPDIGTYQDHTDLPCYPDDSASTTEFVTYGQGEVDFSSDQGYVAGDSPLFCIYDDCDIQSAASPPPGLDDYWVLATLFWTGGGWFYQDDSTCF